MAQIQQPPMQVRDIWMSQMNEVSVTKYLEPQRVISMSRLQYGSRLENPRTARKAADH